MQWYVNYNFEVFPGTAGPFATLSEARDKADELRSDGALDVFVEAAE